MEKLFSHSSRNCYAVMLPRTVLLSKYHYHSTTGQVFLTIGEENSWNREDTTDLLMDILDIFCYIPRLRLPILHHCPNRRKRIRLCSGLFLKSYKMVSLVTLEEN